jgi:hypothetical protein
MYFAHGSIKYLATVRGTALKLVTCEQCKTEYVYRLERSASHESQHEERALSVAQQELSKALTEAVDPVPCPSCGWYQADMVVEARRLHRAWIRSTGGCLFFLFVILLPGALAFLALRSPLLSPRQVGIILAVVLAVSAALLLGRILLAAFYFPNEIDVEVRKLEGKSRALLAEKLDDMEPLLLQSLLAKDLILPTKTPALPRAESRTPVSSDPPVS